MQSYDRRLQAIAFGLSALAGFVDATGFLSLGGFFVSFMTGNSTLLAVGIASLSGGALVAGGLIGCFLIGVIGGTLLGKAILPWRRVAVLLLVALLLALAAGAAMLGHPAWAAALMAMAMGAENAMFGRDGEVHIGLTYMTGALVKTGQRIAAALAGGDRWGWVPQLFLWAGLVLGAVVGALLWPHIGLLALWLAAPFAAVLALFTALMGPEPA